MKLCLNVLLLLVLPCWAAGQPGSVSFQKLGLKDGLHDGTARCIGQDKYGYIWIGTVGALNRFDGKKITQFTNIPGDSTSPYGSQPRAIYSDRKGRLWISCATGLMRYDFATSAFIKFPSVHGIFIYRIVDINDTTLLLATTRGLIRLNPSTGSAFFYAQSKDPAHAPLVDNAVFDFGIRKDVLYLGTKSGLVLMHISGMNATSITIAGLEGIAIHSMAIDDEGNVWMGMHDRIKLAKLRPDLKTLDKYDQYLSAELNTHPLNISDILVDKRNRVWVTTAVDGLLQYDRSNNSFHKHIHNSSLQSSISDNNHRCIFQDKDGIIWLGADFTGVDFFEPDKNFFRTILPFPDRLDERARIVGRAIAEDQQGDVWMGNHDGVTRYHPATNSYTVWRNEERKTPVLYNNVVRTMYCDGDNNIWIGTASGVNRFNSRSGTMEFINSKDLPRVFYNSITADKSGNIWFCGNDSSALRWYSTSDKKFHTISEHPQLVKYKTLAPTSYVMEDSKQRLWISFSGEGLVMLDKKTNQTKHYLAPEHGGKGIIGNLVMDIKEDRDGIIWITCFNGVTGINPEKDTYLSFNKKDGLPGNWASPVMVDSLNRVWMGVNGGLAMLHADRKTLTNFSLSDGLPSIGFPEHAGVQMRNGDIMMATYGGYIRFNPLNFKEEKTALNFYLSDYTIFEQQHTVNSYDADLALNLRPHENAFTFNLVALNYTNPTQTWFAYKLDGFEKEWHYTQDPKAVYTNVPGGHFSFLYKASVNNSDWDRIPAKKVTVNLGTFFYKAVWFWVLIIAMLLLALYAIYRYRIRQQRQMFQLKSKADSLEKEKTIIQYESLKQHLNPHFLFNSLTSLRSLIKTDSKAAAGFLDGMSKIYRYVLKSGEQELVMLQDEIEFVTNFTGLQQVRFGEGLQVNIRIDPSHAGRYIVPVVLQNLVENAIKHNTTSSDEPLVIDIFSDGDDLVVRNNLQRYRIVETSNKSGLASLKKLYRFYTEKQVGITEDDHFFTVRIPLL
ncbi:MAG: two-component regulator propeller domain-containing protein [Bacteroidota bacterium]